MPPAGRFRLGAVFDRRCSALDTPARQRRSLATAWIVAGSLVAIALLALAILLKPFEERALLATVDLLPVPVYAGAAALAAIAAASAERSSRLGWALIAGGILSYVLGDVVWAVFEVGFETEPPAPSLADLFYLAAIPLLFAGVMVLSSSARTLAQFRTLLSATIVVLGLAALLWGPILRPLLATSETGWPGTVVTAAYPVGDAVLLLAVFVAARRQWNGRSRIVLYTFAAGLLLATVSDLLFAKMVLEGTYQSGSLIDLGWPLGFLLLGLAAGLHAHWSLDLAAELAPGAPSAASQRARAMIIAVQATLLAGLVLGALVAGLPEDPSLLVILVTMMSIDLLRAALAFVDKAPGHGKAVHGAGGRPR